METDTSDRALAATLLTYSEKEIYPIVFHLRMLNDTELNYDTYDKELLTIFEVFKKWKHYLEETLILVEVFMDHKNLTYFCDTKSLFQRQAH